jgi:spermidine/putrescine ABC transporter ATP-binding subunit
MARVSLAGVTRRFGDVTAVDALSLDVREGEFLTLLGPSGCGKTTTLRMIAGFVTPTSGRVRIDDEDVTALPPGKRNVGMVFQDYALFPHLTVAQNIGFGLRERRTAPAETARRVRELLALIRLPGLEDRYPAALSGGQQQRVALARALAHTPRVLLMDEPLGALDLKLREAMQVELLQVQRELQITTIYVTHDQDEAMGLSDRIVVMCDGRAVQVGSPDEIYQHPRTPFVASFVGTINVLLGTVRAVDGRAAVVDVGEAHPIRVWGPAPLPVGRRVRVAVRPEQLLMLRTSSHDGDESDAHATEAALPGRVEGRRFLGNLSQYRVTTRSGHALVVEKRGNDASARVGDHVRVTWAIRDAHVFVDEDAAD